MGIKTTTLGMLLALLLVATACSSSGDGGDSSTSSEPGAATDTTVVSSDTTEPTEPAEPSRPLVFLTAEPTQGLDPNIAAADASLLFMAMIYETLTELDADGNIVPALAEGWTVSDDRLV